MKKIEAFIRHEALEAIHDRLATMGLPSMSVTEVKGSGRQKGFTESYRGAKTTIFLRPKLKLEMVVDDADVDRAIDTILELAHGRARRGEDLHPPRGGVDPRPHRRAGRRGARATPRGGDGLAAPPHPRVPPRARALPGGRGRRHLSGGWRAAVVLREDRPSLDLDQGAKMRMPSKIRGRSVVTALATAVVGGATSALLAQGAAGTLPAAPPTDASAPGLTVVNKTVKANPKTFKGFNAFQTYAAGGKSVLQGFATISGGNTGSVVITGTRSTPGRFTVDLEYPGEQGHAGQDLGEGAARAEELAPRTARPPSGGAGRGADGPQPRAGAAAGRRRPWQAARAGSGCPRPLAALHPHVAAQGAGELAADRQAQAAAAAPVGVSNDWKASKMRSLSAWAPRARVGDRHGEAARRQRPPLEAHGAPGRRPAQRVVEEVQDDLLHPGLVGHHGGHRIDAALIGGRAPWPRPPSRRTRGRGPRPAPPGTGRA